MEVISPTNARKIFMKSSSMLCQTASLLKFLVQKDGESVVMISKSDWNSLQETIYLQNAGVLDQIHHFENEESEDLGEIDWDTI